MGEVKNPQNADMLLSTGDEFPCSYPQASAALVRCLNIPLNIDKLKRVLFRLDSYYWKISLEHLRSLFLKQKKTSIISASILTCTNSLFGLFGFSGCYINDCKWSCCAGSQTQKFPDLVLNEPERDFKRVGNN